MGLEVGAIVRDSRDGLIDTGRLPETSATDILKRDKLYPFTSYAHTKSPDYKFFHSKKKVILSQTSRHGLPPSRPVRVKIIRESL